MPLYSVMGAVIEEAEAGHYRCTQGHLRVNTLAIMSLPSQALWVTKLLTLFLVNHVLIQSRVNPSPK